MLQASVVLMRVWISANEADGHRRPWMAFESLFLLYGSSYSHVPVRCRLGVVLYTQS